MQHGGTQQVYCISLIKLLSKVHTWFVVFYQLVKFSCAL